MKVSSEEMEVHVACVMRMRPVSIQIWGFGCLDSRSSVAERRSVSHFFAVGDWSVVSVKNLLGLGVVSQGWVNVKGRCTL